MYARKKKDEHVFLTNYIKLVDVQILTDRIGPMGVRGAVNTLKFVLILAVWGILGAK